jgi:hypothetical protein
VSTPVRPAFITFLHFKLSRYGDIFLTMKTQDLSKYLKEIGSRGGKARAKALTPARRKAIALKAAKASAKARKKA